MGIGPTYAAPRNGVPCRCQTGGQVVRGTRQGLRTVATFRSWRG